MEIPYSIVSEQDQNEWMNEWRTRVECEQKREGFWDPKSWGTRKQKGRDNESEQREEEGGKVWGEISRVELSMKTRGVAAWKAPPKWREICLQSVDDAVQWYSATCTIQSCNSKNKKTKNKKLLKRNQKWLCFLDWCKHFRIVTWCQYGFKDSLFPKWLCFLYVLPALKSHPKLATPS